MRRWRGEVVLAGDVVVPKGAVLEIEAGTSFRVAAPPRWKYNFERPGDAGQLYAMDPDRPALVVWGTLRILGSAARPVRFPAAGDLAWDGLVLLGSADARVEHAELSGARLAAAACFDRSRLSMTGSRIFRSRVGVLAGGFASAALADSVFEECGWGALAYDFASLGAARCRFQGNRVGLRLDDGVRGTVNACGFRGNGEAGLMAQGVSRLRAENNAFEGHRKAAAVFLGRPFAACAENRFFGNGEGYSLQDRARLVSRNDIVGPSDRCGVHVQGEASADFANGFFHSHDTASAVHGMARARVELKSCRFFSNRVGLSVRDAVRWRLESCEFRGQAAVAMEANDVARGEIRNSLFAENRAGAVLYGRARAAVWDSAFAKNAGRALELFHESSADLRRCRLEGNETGAEAHDAAVLNLRESEVRSQSVHGLLARRTARLRSIRGRFLDNGEAGVQGMDSALMELCENEFEANAVGAGLRDRASAELTGNRFRAHSREGVSSHSVGDVLIKKNIFSQNRVGVGHFGADRAVVRANRFLGQTEAAGLCTGESAPRWERNRCLDNARALECRDRARPVVSDNEIVEKAS